MRLAEIFVAVRGDGKQLPGDIRRSLARSNVEKLGRDEGGKFTKGFGSGVTRLVGVVGGVLGGLAVGRKINESVDAASDLNETVNKSQVIFQKNAAGIEKWSRTSATAFGLSKNQALSAAAGFGDMFSQLGFTSTAAANMSKSTVQMAADLGSFNNLPTDDVLERISAGFRGEYDSLQAVIPNISAARVQTEALAISGKKNADQLTAQDKATATLAIIQKDGARAMGDFARTSGGYANQQKIAAAQTADLKAKIGQGLLPVFIAVTTALNTQVLPPLAALADKHGPAVSAWLTDVTAKAGPFISNFLSKAGPQFKSLADGTNEASPALQSLADSGGKLAPIVQDLLNKIPSFSDVLNVSATAIGFLADHTDTLSKLLPLLVAGIVAYKVAQLAANVAQAVAVPTKIAEVVVNRQLVKSNKELIASRAGVTAATVGNTVATGVNTAATATNTVTTGRGRAATLAYAAAEKVATVARAAGAVAARVLGLAMQGSLGPIGIVITVVALLVAGIITLWKKSQTFRTIVTGVFNGFKIVAVSVIAVVWKVISGFFSGLITGAAKAFGWVPGLGPKLKTAAAEFNTFKDRTNAALDKLKDQTINVTPNIKNVTYTVGGIKRTTPLNVIGSAGRGMATGGKADGFRVNGPGTTTSDTAGLFALSNKEWVINAKVSEAQGDAAMRALNAGKAAIIPVGPGLARGGRAGVRVQPHMPSARGYSLFASEVAAHSREAARPLGTALAANVANQLVADMGGGATTWTGGGDLKPHKFRGKLLNGRTILMLLAAEKILHSAFRIMQGSYHPGYGPSGGTHDRGGVMDTNEAGRGWSAAVSALRRVGFAAWHRTPAQGFAHHIHSVALGDPTASRQAKNQMAAFRRGGDGLGHGMAAGGKVTMDKAFLGKMGIKVFDRGGAWPPKTLGANMSNHTETVIAGGNGTAVRLDRDTMRELARLFAAAVSSAPVRVSASAADAAFAKASLGGAYG